MIVMHLVRLAPDYSDWTNSQLVERLEELQRRFDERETERKRAEADLIASEF